MPVYQIVTDNDPSLKVKSRPIPKVNAAAVRLLDNLLDTLRDTPHGVGLAAPQIGIPKRAFVVELAEDKVLYEMINPEISALEGREEGWEGCLSVPEVEGLVPRAASLKVKYLDRAGKSCEIVAEGYLARVVQHEYDHLEGVLFTDKALSLHNKTAPPDEADS